MLRLRTESPVGQPKVSEVASGVYAVRLGPGAAASNVYLPGRVIAWSAEGTAYGELPLLKDVKP